MEEALEIEKTGVAINGGNQRQFKGWMARLVTIISALVPLCSIVYILNIPGLWFHVHFFQPAYLALFLFLSLALLFMLYPATKKAPHDRIPWYDIVLIIAALAPTLNEFLIASDVAYGTKLGATILDQILFAILLIVLSEAIRRTFGLSVLAVIIVAFLYAEFAFLLPGLWGAPRFSFERLTEFMYIYPDGIFGMVLGLGATIIILFVTFGRFLVNAGVAKLMMEGTLAIAGRSRGGPAKVAILASGAMATISGSPSANAATTGAITIPLMKELGYKPHFAAAVEAVASTGGVITPPVMGTVAFIMAEVTGLGYTAVIIAAIVPAILYYLALYFQLDFEAARLGLSGLDSKQLPSLRKSLGECWHLSLPIILLIVLLLIRYSVTDSALLAIAATILVSWLKKDTRMNFNKIVNALGQSIQAILGLVALMAAVGIVFGSVTLTGVGINLSTLITQASGGNIWLLAIFTWLVIYISGMAVAEIIVYVAMAVLIVPAFVNLGMPVLAAHMFVFFATVSSMITPPSCPPVYVTCAIAGSGLWRTGFQSMRLGIVVYLVPFVLIATPVLILYGTPLEIIVALAGCVGGIYFLSAGVVGYFLRAASWWQRLFFIAGSLSLFAPGWETDVLGLLIVLIPVSTQLIGWEKTRRKVHS